MRKLLLTAVFALIFAQGPSAQGTSVIKSAGPFATAKEAVNFANSIGRDGQFAEFVCEYSEGVPTPVFYSVVYRKTAGADKEPVSLMWQAKEGFLSAEDAVAFANANRALPRFAPCWNPYKNPAQATITVFYIPGWFSENDPHPYKLVDKSFETAEATADYVNKNIKSAELVSAIFIPEFFAATKQTTNSWRVAFKSDESEWCVDFMVRVIAADLQGNKMQMDSALAQEEILTQDFRIATGFSLASPRSWIVLFVFDISKYCHGGPQTKLVIPTTVYASRRLISEKGADLCAQPCCAHSCFQNPSQK